MWAHFVLRENTFSGRTRVAGRSTVGVLEALDKIYLGLLPAKNENLIVTLKYCQLDSCGEVVRVARTAFGPKPDDSKPYATFGLKGIKLLIRSD